MKILKPIFWGLKQHVGPKSTSKETLFPCGHCYVNTLGPLVVTFIGPDAAILSIFMLDTGRHHLRVPRDILVEVECDEDVRWSVEWPRRWNPADSTRVEVPVTRPRSQQEEMKEYVSMLVARATGQDIKPGEVHDEDDFELDDEEFNLDAPESIYQLEYMIREMQEAVTKARDNSPTGKLISTVDEPEKPQEAKNRRGKVDAKPTQADPPPPLSSDDSADE